MIEKEGLRPDGSIIGINDWGGFTPQELTRLSEKGSRLWWVPATLGALTLLTGCSFMSKPPEAYIAAGIGGFFGICLTTFNGRLFEAAGCCGRWSLVISNMITGASIAAEIATPGRDISNILMAGDWFSRFLQINAAFTVSTVILGLLVDAGQPVAAAPSYHGDSEGGFSHQGSAAESCGDIYSDRQTRKISDWRGQRTVVTPNRATTFIGEETRYHTKIKADEEFITTSRRGRIIVTDLNTGKTETGLVDEDLRESIYR